MPAGKGQRSRREGEAHDPLPALRGLVRLLARQAAAEFVQDQTRTTHHSDTRPEEAAR